MIILGIETSCDETACGVVEIDDQQNCTLLANIVFSSMDLHKVYGGVVPEIAARSHIESIIPVIEQALSEAFDNYPLSINDRLTISGERLSSNGKLLNDNSMQKAKGKTTKGFDPWSKIDAIAVTYGAGLGGSLLIGVMTARTLAIAKDMPLYAINHVEAHVYANFITKTGELASRRDGEEFSAANRTSYVEPRTQNWKLKTQNYTLPTSAPQFPLLALIVSGGHTQLALFRDHFNYTLLGRTRDDAIGEAFDKVAKIIGLPYPGGPSIAQAAMSGNPRKYSFPKAKLDEKYEFSFSGLKTAVLRLTQQEIGEDFTFPSFNIAECLSERQKADIAASFQRVALETVVDKAKLAVEEFKPKSIVIAGGVAASSELRTLLNKALSNIDSTTTYQPPAPTYTDIKLCTDNGAMIATLGAFKAFHNQPTADPYTLDIQPNLSM